MRFAFWKTTISTVMLMASCTLYAAVEQIQLTDCLAAKLPKDWPVLAEHQSFKIIEIPSDQFETLHKIADKAGCGFFENVTGELAQSKALNKNDAAKILLLEPQKQVASSKNSKYEIKHEQAVRDAIAQVEPENIWKTLTHLTSYQNRSASQQTGVDAMTWMKFQMDTLIVDAERGDSWSGYVKTTGYIQPSLVTIIGMKKPGPGVVLGAHLDTLNGNMPGADDDGSGSASLLEAARILLHAKDIQRPIYIIWYAAEERGLVGSKDVVSWFNKNDIPVKAVMQFDMTGYRADAQDKTMWVFRDYTDKNLSDYTASLIKHYLKVPVGYTKCGYACSDHASWHKAGIPAVYPSETSMEDDNPDIHTSRDTMAKLSLEHMTNFTKSGLAFAIELASE